MPMAPWLEDSFYNKGWRPLAGWVCVATLAWFYLVGPIANWVIHIFWPLLPALPIVAENLWELLAAMLGIAGLRTYEKKNGIGVAPPSGN